MSVETNNLLLGAGELYIKKEGAASSQYVHVGNLKGNVQAVHEITTVEQKPGNRLAAVRRDKTEEKLTLKAQVCDLKIAQLIHALGQSLSSTQITGTSTLRCFEEITFGSISTSKSLLNVAVSLTNVQVYSLDRATKYARGTAFTVASGKGKLKPLSASFANKTHFVSYDSADTAATRVRVGDSLVLQVVSLKFVHKMANKKFITLTIPRATIHGGLTIPFHEKEYTAYDIQFMALGDTTKAAGQSLFSIIREA
jgi:hypothetical protein